eukprot:11733628-Karenia_brevis.AAC.1
MGSEVTPTLLTEVNAMALGTNVDEVFSPPEVVNEALSPNESDDDTTAGQAVFPVRGPTSAVIRRREASRTPERSERARDREAVLADGLFQ